MKIDYNYMDASALKKTYMICRARGNTTEAEKVREVLVKRGIAVPTDDGAKITFKK